MDLVFLSSPFGHFSPFGSGAISTWIYEVARAAQRQNASVAVVARQDERVPYPNIEFRGVSRPPTTRGGRSAAFRLWRKWSGWPHPGQLGYARRVAALLIRENWHRGTPLFLHNDPELALYLTQRLPEINLTHHFHNQMEIRPQFTRLFSRRTPRWSAVSRFTSEWIAQRYGLPADEIKFIYSGVDADEFHPVADSEKGIPSLNFTGRTGIEKAPDLLLQAAQLLRDEQPNLRFSVQIVGSNKFDGYVEDSYQKRLRDQIEQLQNAGVEVRCTGHVDRPQVAQVMRRAHIHVVPSRWDEPFGLTTLEGMASGLATVVSRTGGSPEVVGDGPNAGGILFERDDADDLARQILPWLKDPNLRREWARKARERALEMTWDRTWISVRQTLEF